MTNSCVLEMLHIDKNFDRAKGASPEEHQKPKSTLSQKHPLARLDESGLCQTEDWVLFCIPFGFKKFALFCLAGPELVN